MANVPINNLPSVNDKHIAKSYQSDYVNPAAFVNNYSLAAMAGRDLANNIKNELQQKYDKISKTKIVELTNELDNYIGQALYDKDNGYFYKTGKNAMGQSDVIMQEYDNYAENLLKNSGLTSDYLLQAQNAVNAERNNVNTIVNRHDREQTTQWQNTVFSEKESNLLNKAILDRNDDNLLNQNLRQGILAIELHAQNQNWDDDTTQIKINDFISKYHENVLSSLLSDGSLRAKQYYEKNKKFISPEKQNTYLKYIHDEEINYSARATAETLIPKNQEEAYKYIDNIENIELRNAVENEYNRLLRHKDTIQKQNDLKISNEIMQKIYYAYDTGGDISSIMREVNISDMSLDQKEKIYKNLKAMQELEGVGNNWADYNILLDMATFNNEEFKNINPANYNLTKEQYNKITEMQRKAANNEYTPEIEMKKAIKGMYNSRFNIQGPEGLHSNEYQDEVVRFLSKVERMQGAAFDFKNTEQLQAIMKGFDYKDPNAVEKNIDETKELFARAKKHGEVYDLMAREYMMFKGENKREPSPAEIYEMAKRSYNTIENNWRERDMGKLNNAQGLYKNISSTTPKKGETKVLTYYADIRIPQISRELGIPMKVTSRYRQGDKGNHGKGRKCDVGMAALNNAQRQIVFERMLSEPGVASIGTSDPLLLKRYNNPKNPKIRDLREYDANYKKSHPNTTMNHVNHIDISFDTRYGGDLQGV